MEPTPQPQPVVRRPLPLASWGLLAVCIAVFSRHPASPVPGDFLLDGPAVAHGQWWRILVSNVEHLDPFHILFNGLAIVGFGPVVERAIGSLRFLLASVVAAVACSAAGLTFTFWAQSAGASGIVAGWLGLALPLADARGRRVLVQWTIFLVLVSLIPEVGAAGHVGGFLAGLLMGLMIRKGRRTQPEAPFHRFDQLTPLLLAFAAAVAFLAVRLHVGTLPTMLSI